MSRIELEIGANTSAFKSGLADANTQATRFASSVKSEFAGMFAAGAILAGIKSAVEHFGEIGDLAEKFKVSAEELQRLGYAGEQSGTSMESVAKGLARVKNAMAEAVQNGGNARQIFESVGISMADIQSGAVTAEQAFKAVATAVANNRDEAQKTLITNAIFGAKLGPELAAMLELGGKGIDDLGSKGAVMSADMVADLKEMDDAGKDIKNTFTVGFGYIGIAINAVIEVLRVFVYSIVSSFYTSGQMAMKFGEILKDVFTGNFKAAGKHTSEMLGMWKDHFKNVAEEAQKAYSKVFGKKPGASADGGNGGPTTNLVSDEAKAAAKKAAEDLLKAQEAYDKAKREGDLAAMSRQEKLNALYEEQNRLIEDANDYTAANGGQDNADTLNLRTKALEIEKQIATEQKTGNDEVAKYAEKLQKADEQIAEAQNKRDEAKMTKAELLAKRRAEEAALAAQADAEPDQEKSRALRLKSIQAGTEADSLAKDANKRGKLTVDSLQAIGGGSGAIGGGVDPVLQVNRDQLTVLREIKAAVAVRPESKPSLRQ